MVVTILLMGATQQFRLEKTGSEDIIATAHLAVKFSKIKKT